MSVAIMLNQGLSLRKALAAVGSSQGSYYYKHKFVRDDKGKLRDQDILSTIRELALKKPIYGTRMMAALLSKEIGRPVNRKLVQHAHEIMGWNMPSMTKKEILRAKDRVEKPSGINQLWQSDMTYIFCGIDGWCYLFNVIDVFSREWISYVFDTLARKENAIQAVRRALEKHPEAAGKVTLRCDNGPQYISEAFQDSMKALRINLDFIAYSTPEQNGHVESFSIKNRPALVIVPQRAPSDVMSPLPLWGEVAHSIVEDTGNGTVVADGIASTVANNGLKEPITYKVKNGRAYDTRGGDEAKRWKAIIESADENANILCEFAVGTGRRERWNTVSEKGALGTMHLALGENAGPYPGGKNHSKVT